MLKEFLMGLNKEVFWGAGDTTISEESDPLPETWSSPEQHTRMFWFLCIQIKISVSTGLFCSSTKCRSLLERRQNIFKEKTVQTHTDVITMVQNSREINWLLWDIKSK